MYLKAHEHLEKVGLSLTKSLLLQRVMRTPVIIQGIGQQDLSLALALPLLASLMGIVLKTSLI